MKKTPGFGGPQGTSSNGNFAAADKKKLIIMGVVLVLVTIGYIASLSTQGRYEQEEIANEAQERPAVEEIFIPEFDFAALNGRIDDSSGGELRIEDSALDPLLEHVSLLTGTQYDALDTINLTQAVSEEFMADPAAVRGRALRLRGTIESLIERQYAGGKKKYFEGRLRLEDGTPAYFAVLRLPEDDEGPATAGSFVRINGLFMKVHRAETESGWERGPFVVGRNSVFSFESVGTRVTSLPKSVMDLVEDDSATEGARGEPFSAYWTMLAYARDLQEGDIDWEAAPELNNTLLGELLADGQKFRAQPFRIPISVNMETRQLTIPENPARLETISQGWIGNQTWSAGNGLIKFNGAFPNPGLKRKDLVTARGFFFRNHLYTPYKGGAAIAPLFVLAEIERFIPEEDPTVLNIFTGVVIATVALIGLLAFLLMRDKRKSQAMHEDLVRRRRERRARQGSSGNPNPGQA